MRRQKRCKRGRISSAEFGWWCSRRRAAGLGLHRWMNTHQWFARQQALLFFFLARPGGNVKFPWARFFIHAAGWLVLITHDDGCTWPTAYSINYMVCKLHPSWDKVHERYFCESIIKWWPETARAQTNWSSYVKQLESPRESTRLARCWPPGFRRYLGNCYHRFQLIEYPNYQTWSQAYNSIRDEQQT